MDFLVFWCMNFARNTLLLGNDRIFDKFAYNFFSRSLSVCSIQRILCIHGNSMPTSQRACLNILCTKSKIFLRFMCSKFFFNDNQRRRQQQQQHERHTNISGEGKTDSLWFHETWILISRHHTFYAPFIWVYKRVSFSLFFRAIIGFHIFREYMINVVIAVQLNVLANGIFFFSPQKPLMRSIHTIIYTYRIFESTIVPQNFSANYFGFFMWLFPFVFTVFFF